MPNTNPFYEMLGGYYPGTPIPPTKYKGKTLSDKENQINLPANIADDYYSAIQSDFDKSNLNVSNMAKNLFVKDVVFQLNAVTRPKDAAYLPERALELGDEEDVGGVQLKLSINPVDWIKDPGKMLSKTLTNWRQDFTDWNDLSNYLELNEMWNPLLRGETVSPMIDAVYNKWSPGTSAIPNKPFQIKGLGVTVIEQRKITDDLGATNTIDIEKDLFEDYGSSFKTFVRQVNATSARNGVMRNNIRDAAVASTMEIKDALLRGAITNTDEQHIFWKGYWQGKTIRDAVALATSGDGNVYFFTNGDKESSIGKDMGAGSLSKEMAKVSVFSDLDPTFSPSVVNASLTKFLNTEGQGVLAMQKSVKDALTYYDSVGDMVGKGEFIKFIMPLTNSQKTGYLDHLLSIQSVQVHTALEAANLKGKIDEWTLRFARESAVNGGLDEMAQQFGYNLNGGYFATQLSEAIKNNSEIIGTKNLSNLVGETLQMYRREKFLDVVRTLEKSGIYGVAGDLLWNQIRSRLDGFTPAQIVSRYVKDHQYFGLVVDKNNLDKKNFVNSVIHSSRVGKIFDNNQSITFSYTDPTILDPDKARIKKTFRFVGENEKKTNFVNGKYVSEEFKYNRLQYGIEGLYGAVETKKLTEAQLISALNGDKDMLKLLLGTKAGNKYDEIAHKSQDFLTWLREHNATQHLGLTFSNGQLIESDKNNEILKNFLKELSAKAASPNWASFYQDKVGVLTKLSQRLNILQEGIFKWLNKRIPFLAPIAYGKNVATKAAAKAIVDKGMKALGFKAAGAAASAAAGAATGGVSLVIQVAEMAVQYTIDKMLQVGKKILAGIKEGNMDFVESFVTSSGQSMMKAVNTILIIIVTVIAAPTMVIVILILSAITPVDPTRMTQGFEDSVSPSAINETVEPCSGSLCNVSTSLGCFDILATFDAHPAEKAIISNAIDNLRTFGPYVDRLCKAGRITVSWLGSSESCGHVLDASTIVFGNGQCYAYIPEKQGVFNWLFAHETGHVYWLRTENNLQLRAAFYAGRATDGGKSLNTYIGPSCQQCSESTCIGEDFAENVGDVVAYHNGCKEKVKPWLSQGDFWIKYSGHGKFAASSFMFGP